METAVKNQVSLENEGPRRRSLSSRGSIFLGLLIALLLIIISIPYLKNGFWADDSLNSQIWGVVNRFNTSVWEFSATVSLRWIDSGRILFSWPWTYGFFYFFRDELAVRTACIVLLAINLLFAMYLLRKKDFSWRATGYFVIVFLSLMQLRGPSDPIAAYAGFSQFLVILLLVALTLLQRWLETGKYCWLLLSSVAAVISMTCYEINVLYVPIALVAVFFSKNRNRLLSAAVVLLPFFVFVLVNAYVKHVAISQYPGSAVGSISLIPVTFLKQLIATFPAAYYVLAGHFALPPLTLFKLMLGSKLAWLLALVFVFTMICIARQQSALTKKSGAVIVVALALLFVPPALLSISARYQAELVWGVAHIPVYYQMFGLAIIAALLLERLPTKVIIVMAPIVAMYVALSWVFNMQQSTAYDNALREPRDSFVSTLHNGLLDNVRDGDILEIKDQPVFINGNLIYQEVGKRLSIPDEAAIAGWFEAKPREDAQRYRLARDPSDGNRWVIKKLDGNAEE